MIPATRVCAACTASSYRHANLVLQLLQRLALTYLVPRLAPWRYMRDDTGPADLANTLGSGGGVEQAGAAAKAADAGGAGGGDGDGDNGDEDFEIAEEVGSVEVLGTERNEAEQCLQGR